MARKSSIKTLPPEIQAAVVRARESGATIDEIVEKLADFGHPRSRSAVGRAVKEYDQLAERQRDIRVMAEAFGKDFGGAENAEGKLMVQMLTSIGARMLIPLATEEKPDLDSKEFLELARSTQALMGAAKLDSERDAKVAELAIKRAAKVAEAAMRRSGASKETLELVKAEILGLAV